jgi:hypothetical protein
MILWVSGALLGVMLLMLVGSFFGRGKSDAAGNALENAYLVFGVLLWGVLAGLTALGAYLKVWPLQAAPVLLIAVPLAFWIRRRVARALRLVGTGMPTSSLARLYRAAGEGDVDTVRTLLPGEPRVKEPAIGAALLETALDGRGSREVIDALLAAGIPAGATLSDGSPATFRAFRYGWHDLVEKLIRAGADPNTNDRDGWPLIVAHASETRGFGPGNWSFVRKLLDLGADPDRAAPDGTTVRALFAKAVNLHPDHEAALRARLERRTT